MVQLSNGSSRIYGEAAFEILAKAQALEKKGKNILHFEIGEKQFKMKLEKQGDIDQTLNR